MGLLGIDKLPAGTPATPGSLAPYRGEIHFNEFAPVILNLSSREIQTGVSFAIVDEGTATVTSIAPAAAAAAWDEDNPNEEVWIQVSSAENKVTRAPAPEGIDFVELSHLMVDAEKWFEFTFDRAAYEFIVPATGGLPKYELSTPILDNAAGTALELEGRLNPFAEWEDFDENGDFGLVIEYAFRKHDDSTFHTYVTAPDGAGDAYGFEDEHNDLDDWFTTTGVDVEEFGGGGMPVIQQGGSVNMTIHRSDTSFQVILHRIEGDGIFTGSIPVPATANGGVWHLGGTGNPVYYTAGQYSYDNTTGILTINRIPAAPTTSTTIYIGNNGMTRTWNINLTVQD
jgi:hypothetical protein